LKYEYINFLSAGLSRGESTKFLNFSRLVAFGGIALGSMALIISLSVLEGFEHKLFESAVSYTSHISARSYSNKPLENSDEVIDELKTKFPQITRISKNIDGQALIRKAKDIEGIGLRGVESKQQLEKIQLKDGSLDSTLNSQYSLAIGTGLARKIDAKVGDEVIIYGLVPDKLTESRIKKMKITAIVQTGMAKYDDILAITSYEIAREMFAYPEGAISLLEIDIDDINQATNLATQFEDVIGFPYFFLTYFDLHIQEFMWIQLQKEPIPLALGFIVAVAALNVITVLLITVVEKTKAIGLFRALGMKRKYIMFLFFQQGLKITLGASLFGCLLGFITCWLQDTYSIIKLDGSIYFLDVAPVSFNPNHYAIVILTTLLLGLVVTIIPAYAASRVNPVTALRFK